MGRDLYSALGLCIRPFLHVARMVGVDGILRHLHGMDRSIWDGCI